MKIYAVRDRMIDYFLQPFAAPDDKNVLAAIARQVNHQESTDAIAQTPHHFEIWRLGQVEEDGTLTPGKEFIADASSLIRGGVRGATEDQPRAPTLARSQGRGAGTPGHPPQAGSALQRAPTGPLEAEDRKGAQTAREPQ